MFSFKEKICFSDTSHKNNTGWVKRREIKFYPLLVNVLHHQTGMMTEPQLNESSDSRMHPKRWVTHQYVSHCSNIFVWCHQPSREFRVSQSVSHHSVMRSRSQWRLLHERGGYDDCNVSFPWAHTEGGLSLVAASCSYRSECCSACLSEFTYRAKQSNYP